MKKFLTFFLGLILLTSSCTPDASKVSLNSEISFKTTFIGYLEYPFGKNGFSYLMINAKLINNTNKPFELIAYNCATAANFVAEPTFIKPLTYECSRNYPVKIRLSPKQELTMPVILECPDSSRSSGSKLKIGFILVNPNESDLGGNLYSLLAEKRNKCTTVLWSEPLCLDSGNGDAFEIITVCDSIVK